MSTAYASGAVLAVLRGQASGSGCRSTDLDGPDVQKGGGHKNGVEHDHVLSHWFASPLELSALSLADGTGGPASSVQTGAAFISRGSCSWQLVSMSRVLV